MDDLHESISPTTYRPSEKPQPIEEMSIEEIQKEILRKAQEKLQDERAISLQYQNSYNIDKSKSPEAYEGGPDVKFIMLNASNSIGEVDQVCIAIINNPPNATHKLTLGSGLLQALKGEQSLREVSISRFHQTKMDRFKGGGTYWRLNLSDTVHNDAGTFSTKGRSYEKNERSKFPPFADRWRDGGAQLGPVAIYDTAGRDMEFEERDYKHLLTALRRGKVDTKAANVVTRHEQSDMGGFAKVVNSKPIPTTSPTAHT